MSNRSPGALPRWRGRSGGSRLGAYPKPSRDSSQLRVPLQIVPSRRLPGMTQRVVVLSAKHESITFRQQKRWVKAIRWVVPGSRLFKTCFGCNRAVRKVARSLCRAPKQLPSRSASQARQRSRASPILGYWLSAIFIGSWRVLPHRWPCNRTWGKTQSDIHPRRFFQ
jgi:hypothetical protein